VGQLQSSLIACDSVIHYIFFCLSFSVCPVNVEVNKLHPERAAHNVQCDFEIGLYFNGALMFCEL